MLRVRDIMTTEVFVLDVEASVEEAAWALARRNIGGAPVKDAEGRIAGFLSAGDLANPSWTDWVDAKKATVEDIMTPDLLAVAPESPAMHAVDGMAARGIHHVVVVDANRYVVGMVSTLDVVRALASGQDFGDVGPDGSPPPLPTSDLLSPV